MNALAKVVTCGIALLPYAAMGENFVIKLNESASQIDKAIMQKKFNAQQVLPIESLGKGYEVWTSKGDIEKLKALLLKEKNVTSVDHISLDYRELFSKLDATGALAPDVARNLKAVEKQSLLKDVKVVKGKSGDLTRSILVNGFGIKDGFDLPGTLKLELPGARQATIVREYLDLAPAGQISWQGRVLGVQPDEQPAIAPGGSALFSIKNGNITGRVSAGGEVYVITPLGEGVHAIGQLDASKVPAEHPPFHENLGKKPYVPPKVDPNADVDDSPTGPTIRVGVVYTEAAAEMLAGQTPEEFSQALIDITNQSYVNSRVKVRVALAGATTTSHVESSLVDDRAAILEPSDSLKDVHAWKRKVKANVVVMVVQLPNEECGLSGEILATEETAFAVVNHRCALPNLSFAHEVGHLQGARHDLDSLDQPFPYGRGYAYAGHWRTIMAYPGTCNCTREPYWADPNIKRGGVPMGTADRNHDARVLGETARTISRLRP